MSRKRENDVLRQARVKQQQIEIDEKIKALRRHRDVDLEADTVERCSDMVRNLQSKHQFMAYPERMDSIKDLQYSLHQKHIEASEIRDEVSRREAEVLRRQHPAILEVTDNTKAVKLAESMFHMYTVYWTKLQQYVRRKVPVNVLDQTIIGGIRDLMELCYRKCAELCNKQRHDLLDVLYLKSPRLGMTKPLELRLKAGQKEVSPFTLSFLYQAIKSEIMKEYSELLKRLQTSPYKTPLTEFLERCIELCWYSQIRDPPVAMEFSLLGDLSLYEPYSGRGPSVDYVVWPVLFLYKDGPLLAKGVAEFI